MSGEPAAGRRPRDSSHSRPPQGSAKRGRPASKARTSCPVCKQAWRWCSVACAGRANAGRAATGEATPGPGAAPERLRLSGSWSMQVGAAAAAAHLRNVFARAGVDSPPACLPAGSHNGSGCRGRPSGLGMHNNSARRCADRAVNRGRRSNVWGTGGRATASGQQSLSATAGFSQTRAPREQGPHELSGLQASMEVVQCGLRREGRRGASCNGRGDAGARCGAGAG